MPWQLVYENDFRTAPEPEWILDGLKGTVHYNHQGMVLNAGPKASNDSNNVVLWCPRPFSGDLKIEYQFTRLDTSTIESVNIIYLHALGSGKDEYVTDIMQWNELREIPAMRVYFNHMNTYHISYAVSLPEDVDYVRARRYLPETGRGLDGTALFPEYHDTNFFHTGTTYQMTVIFYNSRLFMQVSDHEKSKLFWFDTTTLPSLSEGYIGFRQMWTRSSRYADFRVSTLESGKVRKL